ncbi:MAG: MCP four helix bundle domain-containing protein [Eubacterium sp.]|nr:MCP four helix bundle domain-containing protein [Eubacterium sp.]
MKKFLQNETIEQSLRRMASASNRMFVVIAILMLIFLGIIAINFSNFYHVQYVTEKYQLDIRKDVQTINKRLLFALVSNDADITAEQTEDIEERFEKITTYFSTISQNLNDENLGNQLNAAWEDVQTASHEMLDLINAGDTQGALDYYNNNLNEVSEVLADLLDSTGELADQAADNKYKMIMAISILAIAVLLVTSVITIIISRKKSSEIINQIRHNLAILDTASKEIAEGNVHVEIDYNKDDEIGVVANQLRNAVTSLTMYIDKISEVMSTMADGNFNINFEQDFEGDFASIQTSIESFSQKISESMYEIVNVSGMVSGGAGQLADAGQSLADTVSNQANIVDGLSERVNVITTEISENSNEAESISEDVDHVVDSIILGNKKMDQVVEAMNAISTSSEQISKILDTINNIADQTNLLSLNASIEAARAGEAGKGFAVVASEVSALAGQTVEAAQNTAELIDVSLRNVQEGIDIANATAEELNNMVHQVEGIRDQVKQIAGASTTQAHSVQDLSVNIGRIAEDGRNNAATSEESLALSYSMSEHADSLKALIDHFELKQ